MKEILAMIAFATAFATLPLSAADSNQRSITTMGTVNVTIPADSAKLFASLSVLDPTVEASNSHLDNVFATLLAELKTRGIPEKSVVLKNRDVRKSWDTSYVNNRHAKTFLGYTASARVIISIDDISKLSPLITYLGLHEEYGSFYPELRSSKIGEKRKSVLSSALRAARNKAEIIAKEGGAKLGTLLNAIEEEVRSEFGAYNSNNFALNTVVTVPQNNAASNDNDFDNATPTGDHVISINVRIRATFTLE